MVRQNVEHDGKSQDVTAHHKDQEDKLRISKQLPAETTHEHVASVPHVVDMGIP